MSDKTYTLHFRDTEAKGYSVLELRCPDGSKYALGREIPGWLAEDIVRGLNSLSSTEPYKSPSEAVRDDLQLISRALVRSKRISVLDRCTDLKEIALLLQIADHHLSSFMSRVRAEVPHIMPSRAAALIAEFDFCVRTRRVLSKHHIHTTTDLCSMTEGQLRSLKGMSNASVLEILDGLRSRHLCLQADKCGEESRP